MGSKFQESFEKDNPFRIGQVIEVVEDSRVLREGQIFTVMEIRGSRNHMVGIENKSGHVVGFYHSRFRLAPQYKTKLGELW